MSKNNHMFDTDGVSIADARRALSLAFKEYSEKFPSAKPILNWKGDEIAELSISTPVGKICGTILVNDACIGLSISEIPLLARSFLPKAIEIIKEEVGNWCKKIKNGEV